MWQFLDHLYQNHLDMIHGLELLAYVELRQWMVQNEKKFLDLVLLIPVAILNALKKKDGTMPDHSQEEKKS